MEGKVNRRDFLNSLGVTVGAAAAASTVPLATPVAAQTPAPRGNIPTTPIKTGHMTFLTGPAAVLSDPSLKGHILAAEEINAAGGILGRKLETITADEAAGTDANVKELRRMKLSENIDLFTGIISSGNTPALGPVSEELGLLTIFTDGCTDFLFERAVPNPKYVFRITNIQSADGVTCAVAAAMAWGDEIKTIAHIHPDYSYGRNAYDHINIVMNKLIPGGVEVVSEGWPKLGTTDFTPHITKAISADPDIVFSSVWGGDYTALYKQGNRFGLFKDRKFATTLAMGVAPHAVGKDHPEGIVAGVHANYYFTYPPGNRWPKNTEFVQNYHKRWNEYPNFQSDGAYTALYMYKIAIEKANQLVGGWPEDEAIIAMLEGMYYESAAGYIYIRPDNHQGYKDVITGFSKNVEEYPFQILDPETAITMPVRNVTAPPGWPKPGDGHDDPTSAYNWIKETWPQVT